MPKATSIKNDLIFNPQINTVGRRIIHVLSNIQNVAILCCFVTFCKQPQRNEQRIITHAYKAIVFVAVAGKICSIKLLETE